MNKGHQDASSVIQEGYKFLVSGFMLSGNTLRK